MDTGRTREDYVPISKMYEHITVKHRIELNSVPLKDFNTKEMDLFFSICAKLKGHSTDRVRLSFEDLRTLSNYKITATEHFVKDIDSTYEKMLRLTIKTGKDNLNYEKFVLFPWFSVNSEEKYVEIGINKDYEYILNDFSNSFVKYELKEFTKLRSRYAKTAYRLFKQFSKYNYYVATIENFRELFDIPESYAMNNIRQRVFEPIVRELTEENKYFDFVDIETMKKKKGNKITHVKMTYEEYQDDTIEPVPMINWLK